MCQFCDIAVNMTGSKVVRDREFVKTMMAYGVNTKDCNGKTPLHHAIEKNLPTMVEKLVKNGANHNLGSELAVLVMLFKNDIEMGKRLLTHGAIFHNDWMILAIMADRQEWVKMFLDHGFEVDKVLHGMFNDGNTGLQIALENGRTEIFNLFLQHGASLRFRNLNGDTALEQTSKLTIIGKTQILEIFKNIVFSEHT